MFAGGNYLETDLQVTGSEVLFGGLLDIDYTIEQSNKDRWNALLGFNYFRLGRDGTEVSELPLRFGDMIFPANLPLSSYFNVDVYALGYSYSFIHDEKKELAFNIGLQFQDIEVGIAGNDGPGLIRQDSDVYVPLPTFGGTFDYAITDKWIFTSLIGVFAIELDLGDNSKFAGEIVQVNTGVTYKAFENVAFALQYNYFDLDVKLNDPAWLGGLKYEYHGPVLSVAVFF